MKIEIYTDGACIGNPGPGGWAAVILVNEDKKEIFVDNVICNGDPPLVYDNLKTKSNLFFSLKRKRMEYSMGLLVYYFGTKKT